MHAWYTKKRRKEEADEKKRKRRSWIVAGVEQRCIRYSSFVHQVAACSWPLCCLPLFLRITRPKVSCFPSLSLSSPSLSPFSPVVVVLAVSHYSRLWTAAGRGVQRAACNVGRVAIAPLLLGCIGCVGYVGYVGCIGFCMDCIGLLNLQCIGLVRRRQRGSFSFSLHRVSLPMRSSPLKSHVI